MSTSFHHLRSPVSCLFYQFTFKRYVEDDIFTDRELDCIREEIISAVHRFDQLTQDRYDLKVNSLPKPPTAIVPKPWTTLFYQFLFNPGFKNDISLSEKCIQEIHSWLVELAERFRLLEAYRACQNAMFSEAGVEPSSSSSGINDTFSENQNDIDDAELAELHFSATTSDADNGTANTKCLLSGASPKPLSRDCNAHTSGTSTVPRLTGEETQLTPHPKELTVENNDRKGKEAIPGSNFINSDSGSRLDIPQSSSGALQKPSENSNEIPRLRRKVSMTPPGIDNPSAVCNDQPFKARSIPPIVNNVGADSGRRPDPPCNLKSSDNFNEIPRLRRTDFVEPNVGTKCSSTDGTKEIGRLRIVPSDLRNFCSESRFHNGPLSKPEHAANIGEIPRLRRTGFAAESCTVGNAEPARVMIIPSNIASLGADSGFRSASRSKPDENANAVPPLIRTPFANPCSLPISPPSQNTNDPTLRLRLTDFAKPYEGIEVILFGTRVKRFDGKGLNRPLGVKYDESLRQWIVADTLNNRIVLIPRGNIMMSPRLIEPCAVTILQPGVSFAVLTKYEIRIMYYGKPESNVVVSHSGTARGLATTSLGNLITMEKIRGYWQVSVYEGKPAAKLVWSCPYPAMNNALPSFLDVHRGTLVVTDLGTQSIVKFFDETGTDSYKYRRAMTLEANPRSPRRGAISYMSGVYIDDELNMLIADAKGRSLQVFNSDCMYLYSVKLQSGGFPYISGLWVNRDGLIGVCARGQKDGGLHIYHMRKPVAPVTA